MIDSSLLPSCCVASKNNISVNKSSGEELFLFITTRVSYAEVNTISIFNTILLKKTKYQKNPKKHELAS